MKEYVSPKMEIVEMKCEDVITSSDGSGAFDGPAVKFPIPGA